MKKHLLLLVLFCVTHSLSAQTIIEPGDPNSGYEMPQHLWDWGVTDDFFAIYNVITGYHSTIYNVFYCDTLSPRIYGIGFSYHDIIGNMDPLLYLRMYTCNDSSFELVESVSFKDTVFNNKYLRIPYYRLPVHTGNCDDTIRYDHYFDTCTIVGDTLYKMYEVFFKRGHIVNNSCYAVGAFLDTLSNWSPNLVNFYALFAFPCMQKMHTYNGIFTDYNSVHSVSIFPITSRDIWLEHVTQHCGPVGTPMVVVSDDRTIACWVDTNDHCLYELAYGPTGIPTDSLTTLTSQFKSVLITDLEPGTEYAFRVRGQCCYEDTIIVWSDWSDTIHFSLPQSGMGTAEGPLLQLTPNPAKETVLVSSDETILTLTIIDMSGRTVAELHPKETSATLDTRSLPSATYLVRITTNHGITVKKLVVE